MTLKTHRLRTVEPVRAFLDGTGELDVKSVERAAAYDFITETLNRLGYAQLSRADKGVIRQFLVKMTGLSRAQTARLSCFAGSASQYRATGRIRDRRGPPTRPFPRRYTGEDIRLLAEVDALHGTLSGPATRKRCERAYQVFADPRFERLARISNGHLYNLRHSTTYQRRRGNVEKTRAVHIRIGERRRPHPQGHPGFVPGGHRPSGRPRRCQGPVPHQSGRRGHTVPTHRLGAAHQRTLPAPGA